MLMNLTKDDVAMVAELLRTRMQELRGEAHRTDDRRYRDELLEMEHQTMALLRRLEGEDRAVELRA